MRQILFTVFLMTLCFNAIQKNAWAEIIDLRNEEKAFGDWKVFCEIDEMMGISHCKIAAKFYDNASAITIQPMSKSMNQFFVIIPQVQVGSFVKIRADQNDLLLSRNISDRDFGLVPFDDLQKNSLFTQMKNGEFLFLRFNVRDSEKEITVKLNLRDFRSALGYLNSRNSQHKK
ncbi:MAG: hypothetical protein KGP29_00190 [Proteobacteria bacterium]|nr:hypothetical protein [Pseudomonadota bacterium]